MSGVGFRPAFPVNSEIISFRRKSVPRPITDEPSIDQKLIEVQESLEKAKKQVATEKLLNRNIKSESDAQSIRHEKEIETLRTTIKELRKQLQELQATIPNLETSIRVQTNDKHSEALQKKDNMVRGLQVQVKKLEDQLSLISKGKTPVGREPEVEGMTVISFAKTYDEERALQIWDSFVAYSKGYLDRSPSQRVGVYKQLRMEVKSLVDTLNDAYNKKKGFHETMLESLDRLTFLMWFCAVCYEPYQHGDFMILKSGVQEQEAVAMINKFNKDPDAAQNDEMKRLFEYHSNDIPKFYNDTKMEASANRGEGLQKFFNTRGIDTPLLDPITSSNSFLYDGSSAKFVPEGDYWYSDPNCHGWRGGFTGMHRLRARLGLFEKKDWFYDGVLERMRQHFVKANILEDDGRLGKRKINFETLAHFLMTKGINDLPPPSHSKTRVYAGTARYSASRPTYSSKRSNRRRSRRHSRGRSPPRRTR